MTTDATNAEASSPLFDAWLAKATRGLCDFAKGQVREEYEDHFAPAYEELRAEGLGEDKAERAAVRSLGDAKKIRRQLKKVYLTQREDRVLGKIASSRSKIRSARETRPPSWPVKLGAIGSFGGFMLLAGLFIGVDSGGVRATVLGIGAAFLTIIIAKKGFYVQFENAFRRTIRASSLAEVPLRFAQMHFAMTLYSSWICAYFVNQEPAFLKLGAAFGALGVISSGLGSFHFHAIARKLHAYPEEADTPNMHKLRYRLEEAKDPQESRS